MQSDLRSYITLSRFGSFMSRGVSAISAADNKLPLTYHPHMSAPATDTSAPSKLFYLREWRRMKRRTQEDLADTLNIHHTGLGKYERGEREPGPEMIVRIARALEIAPGDLFRHPSDPSLDGMVVGLSDEARAHIAKTVKALAESYR